MVTAGYYLVVTYGHALPEVRGGHEAWRYTLMSGVIPAIPLILVRPFLPESPIWQREEGGRHAEAAELRRAVPAAVPHDDDRDDGDDGGGVRGGVRRDSADAAHRARPARTARRCRAPAVEQTVSAVQSFQEFGGLAGRILLAFLAVRIVSRRRLLRLFQVPGLVIVAVRVRRRRRRSSLTLLKWGIFVFGITTIGQFSFWGNYLPRVYPTYLRGTGESFAANVGGRMIGTSAALLTTQLANVMPGASAPARLAYASALVGTAAYVIGLVASFWLPEPKREELPD